MVIRLIRCALLSLTVCCAGMVATHSEVQAIRINDEARRLSPKSVQEIVRLAARDGKGVWLMVGDSSQVLPETWFIDAYLEPEMTAETLRRGRVVTVESRIVKGVAVRWHLRSPIRKYAQVSLEAQRWYVSLKEISIDRPFTVNGDFSDQELISLVSFVRGSPNVESSRVPDRTGAIRILIPDRVDGAMPITEIRREATTVIAVLQDSTRSGQTVTLSRAGRRWKLLQVTLWVA